jgi:hypothetical protein
MSTDERSKRPKLERTQPIRSWSGLFGGATPAEPRNATAPAGGASLNDVVAKSVDLGYRVVEEYIRQGQKAATRFGGGTYSPEAAASDVQDAAARMAQQASDFMTMWAEFMGVGAWGTMGRAGGNGPVASPPAAEPARERRLDPLAADAVDRGSMRLEILSRRPTEVQLDLRTQATGTLVVQGLRAVDPEKPKLADVVLRPATRDDPPTVRVRIPDDQPSGVYRGLIVEEETSRLVGSLTVRIIPDASENGDA